MVMALTDHYLILSICSLEVIRLPLLKFKNIRKNIFRLKTAHERGRSRLNSKNGGQFLSTKEGVIQAQKSFFDVHKTIVIITRL